MSTQREYEKLLSQVARNIQRIRRQKGLTQEEMADLGFNYRHYQKIESGKYSFNLFTLHRLANVFKVRVHEFFK